MPIDVAGLIEERRADKFALFDRHLNAQLVRVLRTLGFAVDYVRAEGAYLFDADGNRYLDLLSGFGVFAVGAVLRTAPAAVPCSSMGPASTAAHDACGCTATAAGAMSSAGRTKAKTSWSRVWP